MKTVALDAMGGDNAPMVEVEGAIAAVRSAPIRVILVGDKDRIEAELRRRGAAGERAIEVHHTSQVITMHDPPSAAVRRKKDSSMRVAVNLQKEGKADAVVSAGNSGAMMACGLFVLKRLRGVDRPAILTTFPTLRGQAALLDMGANVECRPLNLVQFAVMGASFARVVHHKALPRVGVLSNGAEEHKGTSLTRETHRILDSRPSPALEYIGYIEGRDIFTGKVDVVVCDGFTGNMVLKVTEGAAETLAQFLKESIERSLLFKLAAFALVPAFARVKARMDYAEQGGAPLLGVDGICIICHGGSNSKAIKNALLSAGRLVDREIPAFLSRAISEHEELFDAAKPRRSPPGVDQGQGGVRARGEEVEMSSARFS